MKKSTAAHVAPSVLNVARIVIALMFHGAWKTLLSSFAEFFFISPLLAAGPGRLRPCSGSGREGGRAGTRLALRGDCRLSSVNPSFSGCPVLGAKRTFAQKWSKQKVKNPVDPVVRFGKQLCEVGCRSALQWQVTLVMG
jgi:hypothetical protein